ncbi:MAG: protein translocase subunit SecD [Pseudomonadota bacterium]|nr:protein translocase subunit SecD [Pseudomonadota bacterium]
MRYPAWKYALIVLVILISTLYALPNLYPDEPAIQVTGARAGSQIDQTVLDQAKTALEQAGIASHDGTFDGRSALLRLRTADDQIKAQEVLRRELGDSYVVALNLAQTTPDWLIALGAKPMKLGLDLRGGVHFLLEVDMQKALEQRLETSISDVRRFARSESLDVASVRPVDNGMLLTFSDTATRADAAPKLRRQFTDFDQQMIATTDGFGLRLTYSAAKIQEITQYAVGQNLTTMRNRVNELGVAEAVVQTQGANRIVVQLPGVQDTAEAKRVLGRTANLEFRMVADEANSYTGGPVPAGTEAFPFETLDGAPILLSRQRIVTGDRVQNAQSGFDENNQSQVNITLDAAGGRLMSNATRNAVGKQMAVLFIENKQRISFETDPTTGETIETRTPYAERVVINRATVQAVLGSQFRITGVGSPQEAAELALLLRAGALAAPMYFVEERTIGPSLGQENIEKGLNSVLIGFVLVAVFMVVFYRVFGLIANVALVVNVAMILAIMSWIGAALSLPGIAGIVLTIGMAVDANVLIFERIREELRYGSSNKQAIVAGFERAFVTIFDSNLTTLLVAFILFAIGTGPIKGFAVTLSIGILCSMFTAIIMTRGLVQLVYGNRRVNKLSI